MKAVTSSHFTIINEEEDQQERGEIAMEDANNMGSSEEGVVVPETQVLHDTDMAN